MGKLIRPRHSKYPTANLPQDKANARRKKQIEKGMIKTTEAQSARH